MFIQYLSHENVSGNHLYVRTKQCSDDSTALPSLIGIILQEICLDFISTRL